MWLFHITKMLVLKLFMIMITCMITSIIMIMTMIATRLIVHEINAAMSFA